MGSVGVKANGPSKWCCAWFPLKGHLQENKNTHTHTYIHAMLHEKPYCCSGAWTCLPQRRHQEYRKHQFHTFPGTSCSPAFLNVAGWRACCLDHRLASTGSSFTVLSLASNSDAKEPSKILYFGKRQESEATLDGPH